MRDISSDLEIIMSSENCDALSALLLICGEEDDNNGVSILQPEPTEELSR